MFFFGLLNCHVSVSVNCSPPLCLSYKHVVGTSSGAELQASGFAAAAGLGSYAQAYQASSPTHQSVSTLSNAVRCVSNPTLKIHFPRATKEALFEENSCTGILAESKQTWLGCSHKLGTPQTCQARGRQARQITRRRNKLARVPALQTCQTRRPFLHAARKRRCSS